MASPDLIQNLLLISIIAFIPLSAFSYTISRTKQRNREIERYIEILKIKEPEMFKQKHPQLSFFLAVSFVTFLSFCFWSLIFFGQHLNLENQYSYLFGNIKLILAQSEGNNQLAYYQSGALLSFNMAFLGAYLWGIQSIVRRYAMNDLIPVAYYNLGVRMIFACILSLVIYHLVEAMPNILAAAIGAEAVEDESAGTNSHLVMPVVAFLIGMFPQRGLKWLTERFSLFSEKPNPSMQALPLEMIEGVTIYDRIRLQELGIDSCYDLANEDYIPCLFKTPYSPRKLINWILQAKMCVYFGAQVKELREQGIHTVWQLSEYTDEDLKTMAKNTALTEATLIMVKQLVDEDSEVKRLVSAQLKLSRYWHDGDCEDVPATTTGLEPDSKS